MMRQAVLVVLVTDGRNRNGRCGSKRPSAAVVAKRGGFVEQVDARRIVVRHTEKSMILH